MVLLFLLGSQEFSADVASIFICIGLINIPIIKFFVNRKVKELEWEM